MPFWRNMNWNITLMKVTAVLLLPKFQRIWVKKWIRLQKIWTCRLNDPCIQNMHTIPYHKLQLSWLFQRDKQFVNPEGWKTVYQLIHGHGQVIYQTKCLGVSETVNGKIFVIYFILAFFFSFSFLIFMYVYFTDLKTNVKVQKWVTPGSPSVVVSSENS